ncbi:MAG: conjugal transfer protein TraG N-terminal domain-containing protein [Nitrospira sp.]|nr:conjugal transfer protein TraG N-terminal domain-containing protein [Nitrospira sp.]
MTPFLLVLAISPGMSRLMGTYWRLFMWLQTWSPLYAVLNFVMFWEARSRLGAILSSNGVGQSVNYATLDRINEHVAMLNSTAADYVWLVPAIGFGLMWGGSQVLGSILAGSRTAETVAGQVGGQFSRGLGANLEEGPSYRHEQLGAQLGEMIGHDVEPQMTVPTGQVGFVWIVNPARVRSTTPRAALPVSARMVFRTIKAQRGSMPWTPRGTF